jgi:hypothetical protein
LSQGKGNDAGNEAAQLIAGFAVSQQMTEVID